MVLDIAACRAGVNKIQMPNNFKHFSLNLPHVVVQEEYPVSELRVVLTVSQMVVPGSGMEDSTTEETE